jgi:hypothetical protein
MRVVVKKMQKRPSSGASRHLLPQAGEGFRSPDCPGAPDLHGSFARFEFGAVSDTVAVDWSLPEISDEDSATGAKPGIQVVNSAD